MASLLTLSTVFVPVLSKAPFFGSFGGTPSRKFHPLVGSSRFGGYLDLEPKSKPESLNLDVPLFASSDRRKSFDVVVIGTGRMEARLRRLGIRVKAVLEDEKCVIPMGGPLPRIPQSVMAFGGNAGIVHPSTGYCVAHTMALAPVLAEVIVECLGSTRMIRGNQMYSRVWDGLWPVDRRLRREFCSFGMEILLKLDLNGTRRFFDGFFYLNPHSWQGFLSQRLTLGELFLLGSSLFLRASSGSKMDLVVKNPPPFVKMLGNMASQAI